MRSLVVASLITLLALAAMYSIDDRIPEFGFDGRDYGEAALQISDPGYRPDRKVVQRILPSLLVHYGLRAAHVEVRTGTIINGFIILNFLAVAVVLAAWHVIGQELELTTAARLLGIMSLAWNFAIVKFYAYYPVLTDPSAFALGAVMVAAYLKKKSSIVLLCTLVSAFTWQTGPVFGAILLALPRGEPASPATPPYTQRAWLAALGLAAIPTILIVMDILRESGPKRYPQFDWSSYEIPGIYTLSVAVAAAYLICSLAFLLVTRWPLDLRAEIRRIDYKSLAVLLLGLSAAFFVQYLWADPSRGINKVTWLGGPGHFVSAMEKLAGEILVLSVQRPAQFLIAHSIWYGPIVICAILLWPKVARITAALGPGIWAGAIFTVLFSLNSESRHLTMLFPLIVAVTVKAAELVKLTQRVGFLVFFGLTSLWLAKPWMFIGATGEGADRTAGFLYYVSLGHRITAVLWWTYLGVVVLIGWTIAAAYLPKAAGGQLFSQEGQRGRQNATGEMEKDRISG